MWKVMSTVLEWNLKFYNELKSHRSWIIKLGSNFYVVLKCSMLISGSNQLEKGMLSIAVVVKLAQDCCQFQATIKIGHNCIAWFWLYDIQHSHSFCLEIIFKRMCPWNHHEANIKHQVPVKYIQAGME